MRSAYSATPLFDLETVVKQLQSPQVLGLIWPDCLLQCEVPLCAAKADSE
jgi:hypothetical protein